MLHNLLILFTNVLDCVFVFPKRKAWKKSSKLGKSTLADKHKLGDNEVALEASFSVSSLYVFYQPANWLQLLQLYKYSQD